MAQESLFDLLNDCTVRIDLSSVHSGTGFFVAPGYILTCAHVVEAAREEPSSITAYYSSGSFPVLEVAGFRPKPYPDLAILRLGWDGHPCVEIDPHVDPFDLLYVFGYPEQTDQGAPLTLEAEGWENVDPIQKRLKLKKGQVEAGFSGSPVLNMDTGSACGVMKSSRHKMSDLGGWAIPIENLIAEFPEVIEKNEAYHNSNDRWKKAREAQKMQAEIAEPVPISPELGTRRYNTSVIRELLTSAFSVNDLKFLIFDNFREVEDSLTSDMSKIDIAQQLIVFTEERNQLDELLYIIKVKRPAKYSEFEPRLILSE